MLAGVSYSVLQRRRESLAAAVHATALGAAVEAGAAAALRAFNAEAAGMKAEAARAAAAGTLQQQGNTLAATLGRFTGAAVCQ